ncbi:hypothetical protein B9Z47_05375 [Limnohabitans sp. 2KL-1]|nr:hypothetical protein B9Z47_05375 [Limnohabitans sp. 2KL-1]
MVNESRRTFEYKDEKSSKFWEVIQTDSTVTVRYGKTGTNGQSQEKLFGGTAEVSKNVAKLISEKTGKGYVEVGAALSTSEAAAVSSEEFARQKDQPVTKIQPQKASASRIIKPKSPAHDPGATSESLTALLGEDDVTNRLLAKHPRASTYLLEKLSHSIDKTTRQNVAANPNTPPEHLVRLGQQFPEEFLSNPALDLLLMVNPDLMEQVPEALLVRLLKQADCPGSLLTWAAGHQQAKVQLAVAMNAKAPEQATQKLLASQHQSVRETVKEPTGVDASDPHEDLQTSFEQAVKDRFKSMPIHELESAWIACDICLAQWPYLPLAFRLQQANEGTPDWLAVLDQLAKTTWTADAIQRLIGYDVIGRYIARHPNTPLAVREAVLEQLSKDPDVWERRFSAESHFTPVHVLEVLAKDKDSSVRSGVAANPSTPTSVMEELTKDKDDFVLLGIVRNPSISTDLKWALAQKKEHFLRSSIAENPVTPVDLLEVLAKDKNSEVRISVAKNSSTPASILEVMARDSNSDVCRSVLQQNLVPVIVLDALAKDKNSGVRSVVANHTATPGSILAALPNACTRTRRCGEEPDPVGHAQWAGSARTPQGRDGQAAHLAEQPRQ